MSTIFGKTNMPKVEHTPVPRRTDAEVAAAAEEERRRAASTATSWLTGGMGVSKGSYASAGAKLLSGQA